MDRKNLEINPLLETYSKYIKKINAALDVELELYSESEFCEPLKFAIEGGKRIRPIILLLAAEAVGKIDENVFGAACAIE
ncbi:MAG: polyprenyl synthetase family protein, partial [Candidatus Nitrosopelagicus sp.]|nr:polyprenyl synthetase family protein [Candidatus Nitrosopelagicus sp.]